MQIKYYETAWRDISNSPGWFGKLCLLALVNFVPVFGQMVTFGYLYGWAREIAWGVHAPMPAKLICNEDGKFWRRGWFALLITFAFAFIPGIAIAVGQGLQGVGMTALYEQGATTTTAMAGAGVLVYYVGIVFGWFMSMLSWIGSMRASIYDRLSAGFQFGKIWKMFRHDTRGILRIFGMELIVSFILGFALAIVFMVLVLVFVFAGAAGLASAGYTVGSIDNMTTAQATQMLIRFIAAAGVVGVICLLLACYVSFMVSTFVYLLVFRAVGYWTCGFDVPRWRGQDEPLPFETDPPAPRPTPQTQPPVGYYGDPGQMGYPAQTQSPFQQQAQPFVPGQMPTQGQTSLQGQPPMQTQQPPQAQPPIQDQPPQAQIPYQAQFAQAPLDSDEPVPSVAADAAATPVESPANDQMGGNDESL